MQNSIIDEVSKDVCIIHELRSNIIPYWMLQKYGTMTQLSGLLSPWQAKGFPDYSITGSVGTYSPWKEKTSLKSKWWCCWNMFSHEASQKVNFKMTHLYTRLHILRKDKMLQGHIYSWKGKQGCWSESRWNTSRLCSAQMWYESYCCHKQGHSGSWSAISFLTTQKHRQQKRRWQHSRRSIWRVAKIHSERDNSK